MNGATDAQGANRPKPFFEPAPSPGQIYRSIKGEERDFARGETTLSRPKVPRFVQYCRWCSRIIRSDPKTRFPEAHQEAVDFLGWELKGSEFNSAISFTLIAGFLAAVLLTGVLGFIPLFPDCGRVDPATGDTVCAQFAATFADILGPYVGGAETGWIALLFLFVLSALGVVYYVRQYPLSKAREEQVRALTYVPEIIGYMTMSMKLVPNLERAIEFAAQHGRGKISDDLKKTIWDVQLGFYNTLAEGLDALAYRWGKFSDEFKRSLMMIRASVLEDSESKRYILLDKTVEEMLESIRTKMENYARTLSQPSITLFYLGVLLPLILIIILPVGSVFSGSALARPEILVVLYNIVIPLGAFLYARNVIKSRPPTYEPPVIPDDYPGLPPKHRTKLGGIMLDVRFLAIVILVAGLAVSYGISQVGIPLGSDEDGTIYLIHPDLKAEEVLAKDGKPANYFAPNGPRSRELAPEQQNAQRLAAMLALEEKRYYALSANDITPYLFIFGAMFTIAVAISAYLYASSREKRKAQRELMQMETEFRDSLYVLASRMGENKPVEEALQHTRTFLPKTLVAERIYGKTIDNIHVLGMPLEGAVFDKNFGSLKSIPSNIIRGAMKLLVDSVNLGVNVSARTIMSLSIQLSNQEKVSHMLATLVQEVTQMMNTMVIFIAPIVLGITITLQKVVLVTLSQVVQSDSTSASVTGISNVSGIAGIDAINSLSSFNFLGKNADVFSSLVSPFQFVLIVAFYVFELVVIMSYYNTKIEEDNDLLYRMNLAKALPIAVTVFIITVFVANTIVAGLGS
jgi:hypothetical protein